MEFKPLLNYSDSGANLKRQAKRDRRIMLWVLFYITLNAVLGYVIYEGLLMRDVI